MVIDLELVKIAARDLVSSRHAIALTGAGISTESGIRDFRGPDGVWTKNPEAERKAYTNYEEFRADPARWWCDRITDPYSLLGSDLDKALPNAGHRALADLEVMGVLKCVITQNVDALHEKAGSRRVIEYHGSISKLRCVSCNARFKWNDFDLDMLMAQERLPPRCPRCKGIVKTDVVSFGEPIPVDAASDSEVEAGQCDVMLICGTSAVVYPFADLPRIARYRGNVRIIEVNAEPTPLTAHGISDYLIQGKTGVILPVLVQEIRELKKA